MRTVLVTGGAGYIGSHVCKLLADEGYLPVVFDDLVHGHRDLVQWGPLEVGNLRDADRLDEVFDRHRPEAVLHFAAYAYVGESMRDPGKYYLNNVAGTVGLLEAMVRAGVERLVFSSTCATFGSPQTTPIAEDEPQSPINPYGRSKLMVEQILDDYDRIHGLSSVALRYFNAAGADPGARTGEIHDPETHLLPLVLDAAAGRRDHIQVFGDDYPTRDGSCVRDYVHVTDLADAHVRALEYLDAGHASTAFNLGTGVGSSVFEVIDTVREVTGETVVAEVHPPRPGDPAELVAGSSRAADVLGWSLQRSDLATIVADAWRWHTSDRRAALVSDSSP